MISFDTLDPRLFRIFSLAAEAGNFTRAARKAGMTQSGVSQQIAKLEEQLGLPLFERVNKRVLLTSAGSRLKRFVDDSAERGQGLVNELLGEESRPSGLVRYAMPESCLKAPHFSRLLKKRRKFPGIDLEVRLLPNRDVYASLLNGEVDFGFVTRKSESPGVRHEPFAEEEYLLVGHDATALRRVEVDSLARAGFVDYPGFAERFEIWRRHFFPRHATLTAADLSIAGTINHLDGAATMVRYGIGLSVFPRHCVGPFLERGDLFAYTRSGKSQPVGGIQMVTRKDSEPSHRVALVLGAFREMK